MTPSEEITFLKSQNAELARGAQALVAEIAKLNARIAQLQTQPIDNESQQRNYVPDAEYLVKTLGRFLTPSRYSKYTAVADLIRIGLPKEAIVKAFNEANSTDLFYDVIDRLRHNRPKPSYEAQVEEQLKRNDLT